ncbi:hypothetical protein PHYBOEH_006862 [Phytophthora boehmeriae]|uniref:Protein kinase domain-containing protein n=1 Tax=Phytophthora boehmeriae TaxID=109152 RepID=A0A8T1X4D3_9STRA|nr:hypothetical protein PHYBOEH_006862 [Phytophthora boehmeriae]
MDMSVMATSSSVDGSLHPRTGLRRLLSHQWSKNAHSSAHNAACPASNALLQQERRPQQAPDPRHRLQHCIATKITPFTAPFERFLVDRYIFQYVYEPPAQSRALQRQHAVVALDSLQQQQVQLTSFSKASVTEWQLEHVGRVMSTLSRQPGVFQRLLQIWDAGDSWVVVQEIKTAWISMREKFADPDKFSEETLRRVVFQVAAVMHFLHRHELSLAGELVHYDLMMANEQVTLLLHLDLILSGCTFVPATKRNRAADIAAIGMLMFQIAVMPCTPNREVDMRYLKGSIEDHLGHLSPACRDLLLDCLTMKLTVQDLLGRKWLRQVDFISTTHKLDGSLGTIVPARNALYRTLLWKLAAFCMLDWLRRSHQVPEAHPTDEEEEAESTRQRSRRPVRRVYTRARLYVPNGLLRRGPLPVPVPAGHSLLQQDQYDGIGDDPHVEQRRHLHNLHRDLSSHVDVDTTRAWNTYDDFDYDFPSVYTSPRAALYDDFEFDNEDLREGDEDAFMVLRAEDQRSSLSSFPEGDGARDLQKEVVRSLQLAQNDSGEGADKTREMYVDGLKHRPSSPLLNKKKEAFGPGSSESCDAVHFSAFGPAQIALCDFFHIDIWVYLKRQRDTMLESALEHNDVECGQRVQPFYIERGTLVTVSIEPSVRFGVTGEDCKSFRWRGDINGVSFDLFRIPTRSVRQEDDEDSDELCVAKIVAGTKVSMLYIRLQADIQADTGVTKSSDLTLLDAHMEHVDSNLRDIPGEELELIRPIGHGAFGDAVLARWKSTSQEVVVKTMHQDAYHNSDALAEFRHEAEVMNLLGKHPHVVELLGVSSSGSNTTTGGNDSENIALVTEYLPNGSLEDVLGMKAGADVVAMFDTNPSTSLFSRTIMARDAAHGLTNIHQGHFLHRDIAARNCLVDEHFRVKVSDFGLSRRLSKKSDFGPSGSFLFDDARHGFGPLKWMAPESITPPHLFSTYSDSYMFGVLLYEIFSGHAPFPNLSSRDAAALILEGHHVPIPTSLPTTHRQLMEQCFDVHPLRRPSMDQIYSTLDQWVLQDTKAHVTTIS